MSGGKISVQELLILSIHITHCQIITTRSYKRLRISAIYEWKVMEIPYKYVDNRLVCVPEAQIDQIVRREVWSSIVAVAWAVALSL